MDKRERHYITESQSMRLVNETENSKALMRNTFFMVITKSTKICRVHISCNKGINWKNMMQNFKMYFFIFTYKVGEVETRFVHLLATAW